MGTWSLTQGQLQGGNTPQDLIISSEFVIDLHYMQLFMTKHQLKDFTPI